MTPRDQDESRHPDSTIPLVHLILLQPFIDFLLDTGVDADKVLADNGLARQAVLDPNVFVPVIVIHRFLEEAARAAGDPHFGAHVGERLDLSNWPPFVDAALHATSLSEFLVRFICAVSEEASSARHHLDIGATRSCFKEIRTSEQEIPPAQNDGFTAAYLLRLLRRGAGADWDPNEVRITLCNTDVLPDRYQGVYVFAGDRMGVTLRFPTQWLFTPIERGTLTKSSVSRPQLLQIPSDFLAAFRQTVRLQIQDPELNLDRVAQLSGTSRQSLQRKLRKHGTTFSAEFSEIRKIEGERLLTTTARPVTEVAQALGFTNATSFTRAFKAWTGASPREYRRNQQKTHGNFTTAV